MSGSGRLGGVKLCGECRAGLAADVLVVEDVGRLPSRGWSPLDALGPEWRHADTSARWVEVERRRRLLAERLARELAHHDPAGPRGRVSEFVAATAVPVTYKDEPEASWTFLNVADAVRGGASVGRVEGPGGVVMWMHAFTGGDWSLVLPYEPFRGPVLACTDDYYPYAMWVTDDTPEAREALSKLDMDLIFAFERRQWKIDNGYMPPD